MSFSNHSSSDHWEKRLSECLPLFGHRNWIVIADSAYPVHSSPGINTVLAAGDFATVAEGVLAALAKQKHVQAKVHVDRELRFLAESDVPGVTLFRTQLDKLFQHTRRDELPHEEIIARLSQAAAMFRILVIKTEAMIPYTSIFLELECGYRSAEAEEHLRQAMRLSETD
jgi:hypothetical protein